MPLRSLEQRWTINTVIALAIASVIYLQIHMPYSQVLKSLVKAVYKPLNYNKINVRQQHRPQLKKETKLKAQNYILNTQSRYTI